MIDQVQRWGALAGLPATVVEQGPPFRVRFKLEDIRPPMVVEVHGPAGADDPYRFHSGFDLPPSAAGLPATRLDEIVEAAVLGRSALVDARPRADRAGVELIAVVYADGLSRHTFMTAVYECQKVRQVVSREIEAALVTESTLESLLRLSEASEQLARGVPAEAAPPAPAGAPPAGADPVFDQPLPPPVAPPPGAAPAAADPGLAAPSAPPPQTPPPADPPAYDPRSYEPPSYDPASYQPPAAPPVTDPRAPAPAPPPAAPPTSWDPGAPAPPAAPGPSAPPAAPPAAPDRPVFDPEDLPPLPDVPPPVPPPPRDGA